MTALFFGSFNPVHVGHLIIANYFAETLGETWMVLSPHNPHKERKTLANDYDRLALLDLGIGVNEKVRSSNVEFALPKPSYTVDTLTYLRDKYPKREFALIMGGDNLVSLPKWKNAEEILKYHEVHVYVRPEYSLDGAEYANHPQVTLHTEAPQMRVSSSYIRKSIAGNKSIQYLVPEPVRDEIIAKSLYK